MILTTTANWIYFSDQLIEHPFDIFCTDGISTDTVYKKKATLNIHKYSLCFTAEKTFGPLDLRRIVIVFYLHNFKIKWGT